MRRPAVRNYLRRRRVRRAALRVCIFAALLVLATDIVSARYAVGWWDESGRGRGGASIAAGRLCVGWDFASRSPGSGPTDMRGPTGPHRLPFQWTFQLIRIGGESGWLFVPLWTPLLVPGAAALILWRMRVVPTGRCSFCDYDLSGTPSGSPCPECGRSPAAVHK